MEQKSAVVARVLELTRAQVFTGDADAVERESEAFSELYERREVVLKSMPEIHAKMKAESEAMGLPSGGELVSHKYKERLEKIIAHQKEMAAALIKLDEANIKAYEKMKSHLVGDLKNVRQSKDANEKYMDAFYDESQSYYFDKKN
jgi:hypothetical protein